MPGLRWHQQYSYCSYAPEPWQQAPYDPRVEFRSYSCIFPLWQAYLTLLVQWVAYWLAAVYLSNVLPNEVCGWEGNVSVVGGGGVAFLLCR